MADNTTIGWASTTHLDCPEQVVPTKTTEDLMAFIVDTVVVGTLCLVGILGNGASIITFVTCKQTTTSLLLTALAVADLLFLTVHGLMFQCFRSIYPWTGAFKEYLDAWAYIERWEHPIGLMFQTLSIWFVLLVAFDRWIAVCWPLKAKQLSTIPRVKLQIVIATILGIGLHIPRFFIAETTETYNNCTEENEVELDKGISKMPGAYLFTTVVHIALVFIIPIVLLLFINIRLIYSVQQSAIKCRRTLHRNGTNSVNTNYKLTTMLCSVVLLVLICQTPISVNHILYATESIMLPIPQRYFNVFTNLLVIVNSAANFFLYVLFGSKFRQQMKKAFCLKCILWKRKKAASIRPTFYIRMNDFDSAHSI